MKTYQFRLYPTTKQQKRLLANYREAKITWNALLEQSKEQYKTTGKGIIRNFDLQNLLPTMQRQHLHSHARQNVSKRLADSFTLFFSKRKKGDKKARPPRFKSRVQSITYPDGLGKGFKICGNKLWVSKIGNIPIVLHRSMSGDIKTLTIKQNDAGQWYAFFSSTFVEKKKQAPDNKVGVDVGINTFAMLSNGDKIENPRLLQQHSARIKKAQRSLSRKKKGSNNRRKARLLLAKRWQQYDDATTDFLHKTSHDLAKQYRHIVFEDLNIQGMLSGKGRRGLHRSIQEANWGKFFSFTGQQAVMRQGQVEKVVAKGTSQECSGCGRVVKKSLGDRVHNCSGCGLCIDRDLNAAINIEARAGLARSHACGDSTSVAGSFPVASCVEEAGTITRVT